MKIFSELYTFWGETDFLGIYPNYLQILKIRRIQIYRNAVLSTVTINLYTFQVFLKNYFILCF